MRVEVDQLEIDALVTRGYVDPTQRDDVTAIGGFFGQCCVGPSSANTKSVMPSARVFARANHASMKWVLAPRDAHQSLI